MKSFRTNTLNIYTEVGQKWLANLDKTASKIAKKYGLSGLKTLPNLTYNYVLSGFQKDKHIILKLSLDTTALANEAKALRAFKGFGAANIIAEDKGMLILERAMPGGSLMGHFPVRDVESIQIAAKLMNGLHKARVSDKAKFPSLHDWLKPLEQTWPINDAHLIKARKLAKQLLAMNQRQVLLHGDLHHDNILQNGKDWLAIDPKGVMGDQAYEVAAFMRNPIPALLSAPNVKDILQRRIGTFARLLSSSFEQIYCWCFIQGVLSQIWAIENNNDTDYHRRFTEVLDRL